MQNTFRQKLSICLIYISVLALLSSSTFVQAAVFCRSALADSPKVTHYQEISQWHESRLERLRDKDGWLTLVGLLPLEEGENRFGAAADNDLVFPEKAPDYAGVLTLKNGSVRIDVEKKVEITTTGDPVRNMALGTDADDEITVLEMGSMRFYVIERSGQYYVRVKDRESEVLKNFKGIERYPVDIKWRIEARFEPFDPPKIVKVPNILGFESEETCPGAVVFTIGGRDYRLEPLGEPGGKLFFVFGDETSGIETYGGGRFLYTDPPGSDGKVILDFNKAYNPPCVFTPYATCPLPHTANILKVRIEAGEKNYEGASH